jgi:uncharacterized membrane protein YkoI
MDKKWKIGILASFLLVTTAFGVQRIVASTDLQSLSEDEVKKIVAERYPGKIESISMMDVGENSLYNLQLLNERGTYSVTVNAQTGEILDLKEVSLTATTSPPNSNDDGANQPSSQPTNGAVPPPKTTTGQKDQNNSGSKPTSTGTSSGAGSQGNQQPPVTNQKPPAINQPQQQPNTTPNQPAPPQTKITEQQARKAATERTGGGSITGVELLETQNGAVYKVMTQKDSKTVDVRIHAITGKVLSTTTIDNGSSDDDSTPTERDDSAPSDNKSTDDDSSPDVDDDDEVEEPDDD